MKKLNIFLFIFAIGNSYAAAKQVRKIYRPEAILLNESGWEISNQTNIWKSTASIDQDKNKITFDDNRAFTRMDNITSFGYGFSDRIQVGGWTRYRTQTSTTTTSGISTAVTNAGFESIALRPKYSFGEILGGSLSASFEVMKTLYSNQEYAHGQMNNQELVLGDAGQSYTLFAHYAKQWTRSFWTSLDLGYRMSSNHLSHELPYQLELSYALTRWAFLAGVEGVNSTRGDKYTETVNLKPSQSTGATALYNSINRQYVKPYAGLNWAGEKISLELKAASVMSGRSTDLGKEYSITLSYGDTGITTTQKNKEIFKEYKYEATIVKISAQSNYYKIDQGLEGGFEKGMKVDFFKTDYFGGNELVGSGFVFETYASYSIIKITNKTQEILKGFVVRGY